MDERLPGGPLPPADQSVRPTMPNSGDRGAAEAERQAAAESVTQQAGVSAPAPHAATSAAAMSAPVPPSWVDDEGLDTAFAAGLPQEAVQFGAPSPVAPICQWCNARLPAPDLPECPTCHVRLRPLEGTPEVPGLTAPATPAPPPIASARGVAGAPSSGGPAPVPGWPGTQQPAPARPQMPPGAAQPRDLSAYEGLTPEEIQLLSNSSATLRQEISQLNSREALEPPTRDVRQAMLEIEFEADRADPMRIVDPGPLSDRRSLEPPV